MYEAVAFTVDVPHLIGFHQAEVDDLVRLHVDMPHHAGAVVQPVVAPVVLRHLCVGDVELSGGRKLPRTGMQDIASPGGEDIPIVLQRQGPQDGLFNDAGDACHLDGSLASVFNGRDDAARREEIDCLPERLCRIGIRVADQQTRLAVLLRQSHPLVHTDPDALTVVLIDIVHMIGREVALLLLESDGPESVAVRSLAVADPATSVRLVPQPDVAKRRLKLAPVAFTVFPASGEVDEASVVQIVAAVHLVGQIDPQEAVLVLINPADTVVSQRELVGLGIEIQERAAVVAAQSVERSHPKEPFAVLEDATDGVVGNAVVGGHVTGAHFHRRPQIQGQTKQKGTEE